MKARDHQAAMKDLAARAHRSQVAQIELIREQHAREIAGIEAAHAIQLDNLEAYKNAQIASAAKAAPAINLAGLRPSVCANLAAAYSQQAADEWINGLDQQPLDQLIATATAYRRQLIALIGEEEAGAWLQELDADLTIFEPIAA